MNELSDNPLYPGSPNRWITVAPRRAETELILYLPDQNWEYIRQVVDKSQALTFNVTDMAALAARLKAAGVRLTQEPDVQPWGTYATILDSEGNALILVEQPKSWAVTVPLMSQSLQSSPE